MTAFEKVARADAASPSPDHIGLDASAYELHAGIARAMGECKRASAASAQAADLRERFASTQAKSQRVGVDIIIDYRAPSECPSKTLPINMDLLF